MLVESLRLARTRRIVHHRTAVRVTDKPTTNLALVAGFFYGLGRSACSQGAVLALDQTSHRADKTITYGVGQTAAALKM